MYSRGGGGGSSHAEILLGARAKFVELDVDNSSLNDQYFSSLYWSLTMLAKTPWIGPDTILEKVIGSLGVLLRVDNAAVGCLWCHGLACGTT